MYTLDMDAIKAAVRKRGFGGIKPFLEHIGLHRNTLDRFARGASVLPRSVEQILSSLSIPIEKALVSSSQNAGDPIMPLVERIHRNHPNTSLFLFGSRARGRSRKYSDFDLGVYSHTGIPLKEFLDILEEKEQFEEESPWTIDCVNLTNVTDDFLGSISHDITLLAGYERDRLELLQRVHNGKHQ